MLRKVNTFNESPISKGRPGLLDHDINLNHFTINQFIFMQYFYLLFQKQHFNVNYKIKLRYLK